jgi:phosphotransferase system enzyme I (PtsI)
MPEAVAEGELTLRGIPVSAGVSRGKIIVLGRTRPSVTKRELTDEELSQEKSRFEKALLDTRSQLTAVQRRVRDGMGAKEGSIFDAHLLVLEDPALVDEVVRIIQSEKVNAEHAFHRVAERYASTLAAIEDEYLRERAADMRDVSFRVLNNLMGVPAEPDLHHLNEPCILVSHDLTPSHTAQLDRSKVLGFATEVGSRTSHTAIMARSMRIPAVVGLKDAVSSLRSGQYALLDGFNGVVILNPTDQTLFQYGQLLRKQVTLEDKLRDAIPQPAITLDGQRVLLSANIEQTSDIPQVKACGADGVGLFRTEFLFINAAVLPGEEQQYQAYREVAAAMKPAHVVIRTLDLGGDKFLSEEEAREERNPFMGWRAIRFCLQERDLFRRQLRAILRAGAEGNIHLMFPMISGLEELTEANALIEECKEQLRKDNVPFDEKLKVGVMVETPSAAMVADSLASRSCFFSIGTNDLIQYSLAVDRMNERIAHLYSPTHPAIVRLIKATVDAAHRRSIPVSICGEMAGDPVLVPLLLGLGVDELSAAPPLVPPVKFLIRRLKFCEAQELAKFALECESAAEILTRCHDLVHRSAPSLFDD